MSRYAVTFVFARDPTSDAALCFLSSIPIWCRAMSKRLFLALDPAIDATLWICNLAFHHTRSYKIFQYNYFNIFHTLAGYCHTCVCSDACCVMYITSSLRRGMNALECIGHWGNFVFQASEPRLRMTVTISDYHFAILAVMLDWHDGITSATVAVQAKVVKLGAGKPSGILRHGAPIMERCGMMDRSWDAGAAYSVRIKYGTRDNQNAPLILRIFGFCGKRMETSWFGARWR